MSNHEGVSKGASIVNLDEIRKKKKGEKNENNNGIDFDALNRELIRVLDPFVQLPKWDDKTRDDAQKKFSKFEEMIKNLSRQVPLKDDRFNSLTRNLDHYEVLFKIKREEFGFDDIVERAVYSIAAAYHPSELNSVLSKDRLLSKTFFGATQQALQRSGKSKELFIYNARRLVKARREALKGFAEYDDLYRKYKYDIGEHLKLFALIGFSSYLNTINSKYSYEFMLANMDIMNSIQDVKLEIDKEYIFRVNGLILRVQKKLEELKDRFGEGK